MPKYDFENETIGLNKICSMAVGELLTAISQQHFLRYINFLVGSTNARS